MPRIPKTLLALTLLLALMGSSCAALTDQLTDLPKLKKKDLRFKLAQSSKVYDSKGGLINTLHRTENRTIVPLNRIPKHVRNAVIAIEDERFYEHDGLDVRAVLRALLTNAASGTVKEGGSTITQQLVKNLIISPGEIADRTLERKITEAALSRQLEKKLSKRKILESYLNTVYFGNGAYGVQEAANTYFGRTAAKLTVAQAAMIAGIIQAPSDYDPYDKLKAAKQRRDVVLNKMAELEFIDQAEKEKALGSKIKLQKVEKEDRYPAPYFMDYVQRMITYDPRFEVLGENIKQRQNQLFQGGLRIHTTVDLEMQAAAEEAVNSVLPYENDPSGSLVAIDPKTGHIKAMVGGRDYFATRKEDANAKLNLAILGEPDLGQVKNPLTGKTEHRAPGTGRQAGSAFKVFALAAAIEDGIPLSKTYKAGSEVVFPGLGENGTDYTVGNYEGGDFGSSLSLLEATVNSVNVVYAQLVIDDVGEEAVVDVAERMGISPYNPLLAVPSAVLGSNEVNPLDMASAYGTLAANGIHNPPVAITKITGPDGEVIYKDESEPEEALEPAVSYITTSALTQVIQRGTAAAYGNIGRPAAGKTGTAQEYRDAWFVGYTPDLVASVWVGYPEGQIEMKPYCPVTVIGEREVCRVTRTLSSGGVTGGSFPTQIWAAFMLKALSGVPASSFPPPTGGTVSVTIDTRTGCLATKLTPGEYKAEATFASGTEPEKSCPVDTDGKEVPDVVGFPAEEAEGILERAGFTVSREEVSSSTYPPGTVTAQSPGGGSEAAEGSTVTISVATAGAVDDDDSGPSVPDVLGQTEGSAESELHAGGYDVRVVYQRESSPGQARKNSGLVWKQSPASGTSAEPGSTVTIWVNP